jgi:hypothetical protein
MSGGTCPRLPATLAASRRNGMDASIIAHVDACPECGPAVALDRALGRMAAVEDARPFPSAEAIRLEGLLELERRHRARAAAVRVGIHAAASATCVGLLAAAWLLEIRAGSPSAGVTSAACGAALAAVAMSLWNLARVVDEAAAVS